MTTKVSLIADNAVVGAGISNKTITDDDIADSTITTNKIAFGNALVPPGGIIMWSGSTAPSGYQLCNGSDLPESSPLRPGITKTPDLRDKFIVGATSEGDGVYPGVGVNQTGGSADAVVVYHNHTMVADGSHSHGYAFAQGSNGAIGNDYNSSGISGVTNRGNLTELEQSGRNDGQQLAGFTANTGSNGSHSHTINYQGSSGTNANLPPYYALAFIMRVL
jgi:hypothetical protein